MRFFPTVILLSLLLLLRQATHAQDTSRIIAPFNDTATKKTPDTLVGKLRYPIADRRGDFLSQPSINPFDIRDTTLIKKSVVFDPITRQYKVVETINGTIYRTPSYIDFDTYVKLQAKQDEADYFKKRADALTALNKKVNRPPMQVYDKLFDRIFGVSDMLCAAGGQIKQLADRVSLFFS